MFSLPIHPILVHFPTALFITSLVLDLVSLIFKKDALHQTAMIVYICASVVTPLTVYSGLWEAGRLRLDHPVLDQHRLFAIITMYSSFMSLFVIAVTRKFTPWVSRAIFILFAMAMSLTVAITAFHGGRMVYEYGVGVH